MKKRIIVGLIVVLFSGIFLPAFSAKADEETLDVSAEAISKVTELKLSQELTNWALDEEKNILYAISQVSNSLLFINGKTMAIESSLTLNGAPIDIVKEDGKLYIALAYKPEIVVIDIATRKIVKTVRTSINPERLTVNKDKLYYVGQDGPSSVHEYNLTTSKDTMLQSVSLKDPDIVINKEKNLLYIGSSYTSGGNMIYYSIDKKEVVSETKYEDGYGFPYPTRNIIFDGQSVFYASRDFNPENAARIRGNYENGEGIIFVKGNLVYTNTSVYEKDSHRRLGDSAFNMNLVEGTNTTLYIYDKSSNIIKRFNDADRIIDSKSVISLISGIEASKIQENTPSIIIDKETTALDMTSRLTDLVLDEGSNTLYAISNESKALFFINRTTLNIEKSITFTSFPSDIIVDEGKIYVALYDVSQIAVVSGERREIEDILYTDSDPYKIVKNKNKIYYVEKEEWVKTHEYDLVTKSDRVLSIPNTHAPDIAINQEKNILYLGESDYSGCELYYYDINKDEVITKVRANNDFEVDFPKRSVVYDGENIYYAGKGFEGENNYGVLGKYVNGTVIYVSSNYVFSNNDVYDKKTFRQVAGMGINAKLVESADEVNFYVYNEESGRIYKKGSAVQFVKEDVNMDGKVDKLDLDAISANYNITNSSSKWNKAHDLNEDGIIDVYDIVLVALKIKK